VRRNGEIMTMPSIAFERGGLPQRSVGRRARRCVSPCAVPSRNQQLVD
jgi:hypothetical protein